MKVATRPVETPTLTGVRAMSTQETTAFMGQTEQTIGMMKQRDAAFANAAAAREAVAYHTNAAAKSEAGAAAAAAEAQQARQNAYKAQASADQHQSNIDALDARKAVLTENIKAIDANNGAIDARFAVIIEKLMKAGKHAEAEALRAKMMAASK